VPRARPFKASTARSAARAKADQAGPVRRLFGTPSAAPAGEDAADPQEGKRSAQRRSGAKASVERSERPMEARRVETQQVARCTARQRDPATGRGTLTLRAAVSMVGMTASAHIDDLPLVGLATHDLLTCMQVIFGRLDHVELWLLPTEC